MPGATAASSADLRVAQAAGPDRLGPTRRAALTALLGGALLSLAPPRAALAQDVRIDARALSAFIDVLLPADELSPAASALGVPHDLIALADGVAPFQRLIALACGWLNGLGDVPFADLPEVDRMRIVTWMSTADFNQIPRRFYHLVRLSAIELYYAHPESIAGFPLNPAPQPQGYPPPWT